MANTLPATGTVNALGFESEAPKNFAFATWRAIPFSPDGPAVFLDGSKVPAYSGQLDLNGDFNGALIGDTSQMRPPSVSYMFTVNPVASVPPITISSIRYTSTTPQTLGEILSAHIGPLRIQAAALVYAYSDEQIINPTAGCGYVNTTTGAQWVFVGAGSVGMWIEVVGSDTGGGTPAGPNNAVQFNNGGLFGGDSGLRYVSASASLFIGGALSINAGSAQIAPAVGRAGYTNFTLNGNNNNGTRLGFVGGTDDPNLYVDVPGGRFLIRYSGTTRVSFDAAGNASFNDVVAAGTLDVTGAATLDSTLGVGGDTALVGKLAVGGNSSIDGTLDVGQLATLSLLRVLGATTLAGDATLQSTLEVSGAATLASTVAIQLAGKTYAAASINDVTASRAFNTAYHNTSGMTLAVSMTGTTSGSSIGTLQLLLGPANPPANLVSKDENTASVSGAEVEMKVMVPPGWWYEVQSSGDITGIGRWWEWTCP